MTKIESAKDLARRLREVYHPSIHEKCIRDRDRAQFRRGQIAALRWVVSWIDGDPEFADAIIRQRLADLTKRRSK